MSLYHKLLCISVLSCLWSAASAADFVWWEGEEPESHNLAKPVDMGKPGNAKPDQQEKLSGGRWLTNGKTTDGGPTKLAYKVNVAKAGSYDLYVRKFWKHGPFKWRFDGADWQECGKNIALLDSTFLQKHWGANWVALGKVDLKAGASTFDIEMNDQGGCFDCFLLINGAFSPRGKLKPGAKTGDAEPGHFAWEPDQDPLNGESPIDLRYLNEKEAGANGFVQRDGDDFKLGNGKPVKFWMVQANLANMDRPMIDRWAKRLSKYGVNLVRMQLSGIFNMHVNGDTAGFNTALDRMHYVIAALKKEGIYSYIGHLYWHTSNALPKGIIPGFDKKKTAVALPFFAKEFQDFYRGYAKAILTTKNPYTGVSLAKEPALAFIEINNESSLLFHTFSPNRFDKAELALVEKDFGKWVAIKYGSIDAAVKEWGASQKHTPDNVGAGRLGLYNAGFLGGAEWAVNQRNGKRASDQIQWMIEAMHGYYTRFNKMLKDEIGAGSLITGSNWKSADDRILGGLERYSYTATDVVLRNSYFATKYPNAKARQRFYAVELNDTFGSVSALKAPSMPGPLATPQIAGYPFMITENNWTRPNRFRAEWPVLIASYASMMGIDGWCFFALGTAEWQTTMAVWDLNNPTILGQFPATALMYRRGDVSQPGQTAVHEKVSMKDAYALKGTKIYAVSGKDDLWAAAIGDKEGSGTKGKDSIDPRAYFVGPVRHEFQDGPSGVETADLDQYIDGQAKTITSMTGELKWDYSHGVVTVDTPRAQGVTGFLKAAGKIELGDVTIESQNEYGSIMVVSLDDKPLSKSSKILVQTATEDKPFGFKTQDSKGYHRITAIGGYPLNVKLIKASVSVKTKAKAAVVLDGNGYETDRKAKTSKGGKGLQIELPENAIYTLLK